MKRKSPSTVPTPLNSGIELEFVSDSLEYIAHTIEYIGYRDKLDQVFHVAIARAKSKLDNCFKHD